MKRLNLFEAIGLVDDRLVEEAADARRSSSPWGRWLAAAACIALAVSLGTATAGTLLRGCGGKEDSGKVDTTAADAASPAAPAADSAVPSAEAAPEEEVSTDTAPEFMNVQGAFPEAADADAPASEPQTPEEPAAGPQAPVPEPELEPEPEPAEIPGGSGGMTQDEMGGLGTASKASALYTGAEDLTITPLETDGQRARYRVENLRGADRTETLHFTIKTGEEGIPETALEIRIDGETVPFEVQEAIVCPAEDGALPEQAERHFLISFTVSLPSPGEAEVEIVYK